MKFPPIFSALAVILAVVNPSLQGAEKPNVIIILTDDQGMGDLSLYGNPVVQTPHLDALAGDGVSFNQFHVTSMCSPTRAALLTGLNPLDNGVISTCQGFHTLRREHPVLPESFAGAGYATGMFGKWHLGRNWPNRPQDRGFQESFVLYGFGTTGISSRWNNDYIDTWVVHNGAEKQGEGFCTDMFFNQAMDWIGDQADSEKPFFAYIPTNAPHFPFWAPGEWSEKYKDTKNPEFFAMVANLDDNIGRLLEFLDERSLADNTILIFLSDNGPVGGTSTWNAGMTGGKATPWEGGHRVPLFIRYPDGEIAGGRIVEGLADVTDLFPTLLDLCGIQPPADTILSGFSLKDPMLGNGSIPERLTIMQIQQHKELTSKTAAIMSGDWRLLWCDALYNIKDDLAQQTNVADQRPDVFIDLWSQYQKTYYSKRDQAQTAQPEFIGSEAQRVVILDGSNWIGVRADGQVSVREATNKNFGPEGGAWKVEAVESGTYSISLRRWPVESGLALTEGAPEFQSLCSGKPLPAGVALPIAQASLEVDSRLFQKAVGDDQGAIQFEIELTQGPHELHGIFRDAEGNALCGTFYALIEKL